MGAVSGVVPARDEQSLVQSLGPALCFAEYYGSKWDAFIDCAGALAETAEVPVALVWTGAERLARAASMPFTRSIYLILSTAESLALSEARFQLELFLVGEFAPPEP